MVSLNLVGSSLDIQALQQLPKASGWKIICEDNKYYLQTETLSSLSSPKELWLAMTQMLALLNGQANINHTDHQNVQSEGIYSVDDSGKKTGHLFASAGVFRARVTATITSKGTTKESPNDDNWIKKAENDNHIKDALRFFAEVSWWNLYKVYEIIRDDVGLKKIHKWGGGQGMVSLFTKTANSRTAIGDQSRHWKEDSPPPPVALTISEAHILMSNITKKWIESK